MRCSIFSTTFCKTLFVIIGMHRHRGLHHDGTGIEFRSYKMNRGTVYLDTRLESALVGMQSSKRRQ